MPEPINTPPPAAPAQQSGNEPPQTAEPGNEPPQTAAPGNEPPKTAAPGNEPPQTAAQAARVAAKSLLDDDEPAQPAQTVPAGDAQPSADDIKKFVSEIPALDLGDGVKWDDQMLTVMAPALMEMTGGDAKKADKLVKAYANHVQGLAKAQAEAADAFNNGLIAECQKRFGTDLKKTITLAKRGGLAIFGDKIWNEMRKTPAFANNPDILERLADFGRKWTTDDGRVVPPEGGTPQSGDVFERMYGNIKVG